MADESNSVNTTRKLNLIALIAICVVTILIIAMVAWQFEAGPSDWRTITAISLGVILLAIIGVFIYIAVRGLLANWESSEHVAGRLARIETLLSTQNQDIQSIAGMAGLSNEAKSLIYFEREVYALNESVHAMILKQDYDSAKALISRMESRLGMADEVARLQNEVESAREASVDEKIAFAIKRIEEIVARFDWTQAKREVDRLISIFPDNPVIAALPKKIMGAHNDRKKQLLREYSHACQINDIERSIELLKALDKYLTPQEGSALAESARDVFKKKLHNLGVQFAIAVADQQWSNAISTGKEIIREYPNSRMAREVKEKLQLLQDCATGAAEASHYYAAQANAKNIQNPPTPQ